VGQDAEDVSGNNADDSYRQQIQQQNKGMAGIFIDGFGLVQIIVLKICTK